MNVATSTTMVSGIARSLGAHGDATLVALVWGVRAGDDHLIFVMMIVEQPTRVRALCPGRA